MTPAPQLRQKFAPASGGVPHPEQKLSRVIAASAFTGGWNPIFVSGCSITGTDCVSCSDIGTVAADGAGAVCGGTGRGGTGLGVVFTGTAGIRAAGIAMAIDPGVP
jgi:hypothetical protein